MSVNTNIEANINGIFAILKEISPVTVVAIMFSTVLVTFCWFQMRTIRKMHSDAVDAVKDAYKLSLEELRKTVEFLRNNRKG